MSFILGIDTGGTYTDGVIIDPVKRIVKVSAKAFTTKEDLSIGIRNCINQLPGEYIQKISMVCISTTLATNAIVENYHGRVGLFLIGHSFDRKLPDVECVLLKGQMDIKGRQIIEMDPVEIKQTALLLAGKVDSVAVSGFASIRNPIQEQIVKKVVREYLHVPVVCAHELSQSLGFYDRTITAALNAGLITCIKKLLLAIDMVLSDMALSEIPVMVVKGDGSLMSEKYALERPIETILSGAAASVIGGQFLTGKKNAIVLDMGGTTTDIAEISNGKVKLNTEGAIVGGWKTQLKAIDIQTFGCGGDSRITVDKKGKLKIGPERVIPLCRAALKWPNLVTEIKESFNYIHRELDAEQYAECYYLLEYPKTDYVSCTERKVLDILKNGACSLLLMEQKIGSPLRELELKRLVKIDAIQRCGLTPTDLLHITGKFKPWNAEASLQGLYAVSARLGIEPQEFLKNAMEETEKTIKTSCLCKLFSELYEPDKAAEITDCLLNSSECLPVHISFSIDQPVIALGAPVSAWLPEVCQEMHTELIIPQFAEVANAIGAATGSVSLEAEVLIRPDQYHKKYIIHAPWGNSSFDTLEEAKKYAVKAADDRVYELAKEAGGRAIKVSHRVKDVYTNCLGLKKQIYVETKILVLAIGAPAVYEM